jgi:hypothetical protein
MVKFPESNKRPGVCYAWTGDGVELPIVDITHPVFALKLTDTEQQSLVKDFLRESAALSRLPRPLRNLFLRFFLRGSVLAEGVRQAQGSFMSGLHTYLLKLGPQMLGGAYAKPIDHRIAAALPSLAVRLRLQDVAYFMADTLLPALASDLARPLHLVNIAGGPAIDSLNTLIVLNKKQPGTLTERQIFIDVLDLDDAGPAFGKAALAALSEVGGPLHGTSVIFRHVHYDWAQVETLKVVLTEAQGEGALIICSSEGGLFEYGSDDDITSNLTVLRSFPEVVAIVGSVTRADEPIQRLRQTSTAATHPRGLDVFTELGKKAGWAIARTVERPFSDQVVLT